MVQISTVKICSQVRENSLDQDKIAKQLREEPMVKVASSPGIFSAFQLSMNVSR